MRVADSIAHFTELATSNSCAPKDQIRVALVARAKRPAKRSEASVGSEAVKSKLALSRASFFWASIFSPPIPRSARACNFLSKIRAFRLAGFGFVFMSRPHVAKRMQDFNLAFGAGEARTPRCGVPTGKLLPKFAI